MQLPSASAASAAPYASGRCYTPDGLLSTGAGTAVTAGTVYLTPGTVHKGVTIASLIVRLSTLAAGGNCQISLYKGDPVSGDPTGAPIFTSASQSTAATGIIEVATSQALTAGGVYWLGVQCDNSTAVFQAVSSTGLGFSALSGGASAASLTSANVVGLTKTGTFGTWPTLTGNRTTDSLTAVVNTPVWGFKVA